jgi:nascent polypeptide-associated complex subunit alpha
MIPGLGGLNPKKMQAMMKQMGINQDEIPASKVTIETEEGNIIINEPSVTKIDMQGQVSYQISGDVSESEETTQGESDSQEETQEEKEQKRQEDIKTIMEKINCLEDEAKLALDEADGDLTEALLKLS